MIRILRTLWAYNRAAGLKFSSREKLEQYQTRKIEQHLVWLTKSSPYFKAYSGMPLSKLPLMDKHVMMDNFDAMNTGGLKLKEVFDVALKSEQDRNFEPLLQGYTVGLSSGTSARRGVFVASAAERADWAGIMLAKALPRGLFAGERVALFLRANSSLYTAVESRWLTFRFFDLFTAFDQHFKPLNDYSPTIIVAPAQVLAQLAQAKLQGKLPAISPIKVISAAEVLEVADRELIQKAFGDVHEVYQATEGFLASTCRHGTLHLNEEFLHVEPDWLDEKHERFVPIITDFTRRTQPIIRYRLNDVLVRQPEPCPCGSHAMALSSIEGRCDDMLDLPGKEGKSVRVFGDLLSRALAQALPLSADYLFVQTSPTSVELTADITPEELPIVQRHVNRVLSQQNVAVEQLKWTLVSANPEVNFTVKRRRIRKGFLS